MKNQTSQKQAYQAPVVRSVEFKVEQGFAGSPGNIIPIETLNANSMEDISRQQSTSTFSYSWN